MNRLLLMVLISFAATAPVWAATTSQYPNPYRQTAWNNLTDQMHIMGQDSQQSKKTLARLHAARTKTRIHSISAANKAKRQQWMNS